MTIGYIYKITYASGEEEIIDNLKKFCGSYNKSFYSNLLQNRRNFKHNITNVVEI